MKTKSRTQGRRIQEPPDQWENGRPYENGDYWKDEKDGTWHGCTPNGLECWLAKHHVEELPDGTIDVVQGPWGSNSIGVNLGAKKSWHGAIEKGVWVEF